MSQSNSKVTIYTKTKAFLQVENLYGKISVNCDDLDKALMSDFRGRIEFKIQKYKWHHIMRQRLSRI